MPKDETQGLLEELQRQYQRAKLFAEVTLKIRQSLDLEEILNTTVTEVQRILKADRVLFYQVLPDGTGKPISEAVLPDYPAILGMEFPEEVFPPEYQELYAQGRVQAIADVHDPEAGLAECLVEFVEQFDIKAKLIVPILVSLQTQSDERGVPKPSHHRTRHRQTRGHQTREHRARNHRTRNHSTHKSQTHQTQIREANSHPHPAHDDQPRHSPHRHQLWGLLIAHHCQSPRQWVEFELELMQQLADQVGIAIAQGELLGNLGTIVETRTAELKAVNATLQQEIADRTQAEVALRRSEEQLRLITDALPVLIAYVDVKQRYRFNNAAYAKWLGKSSDAVHGKSLRQVWGASAYRRMRPWVQRTLAGETVTYENEIQLANRPTRTVNVTYIPHCDEQSGTVKGFFALTTDISDRKAVERMKDEFISVVSHELRTPLTSIHSALKLLATGQLGTLSEDGQQMLGIADENTDRLVRLVNNVLDLQRIESGAVTMDRQTCDASELMVKAAEAMQAMAQQYQVKLVTHPVSIPLWVDPDYIVQALTNLISNAIKFSASGTTVTLSAKRLATKVKSKSKKSGQRRYPPMVQFRVQDQGQGIPKSKLESIFERFHQVDSSDARKKGGTGLGLTICRKIIEQHDGEIWAESIEGEGSTFIFTLPLLSSVTEPNHES